MYYLIWRKRNSEKMNIEKFDTINSAQSELGKPAYIGCEWYLFSYDEKGNSQIVLSYSMIDFTETLFEKVSGKMHGFILIALILVMITVALVVIFMLVFAQ